MDKCPICNYRIESQTFKGNAQFLTLMKKERL